MSGTDKNKISDMVEAQIHSGNDKDSGALTTELINSSQGSGSDAMELQGENGDSPEFPSESKSFRQAALLLYHFLYAVVIWLVIEIF